MFQLPVVKSSLAGVTVAAESSLVVTATRTAAVGWLARATV